MPDVYAMNNKGLGEILTTSKHNALHKFKRLMQLCHSPMQH